MNRDPPPALLLLLLIPSLFLSLPLPPVTLSSSNQVPGKQQSRRTTAARFRTEQSGRQAGAHTRNIENSRCEQCRGALHVPRRHSCAAPAAAATSVARPTTLLPHLLMDAHCSPADQ